MQPVMLQPVASHAQNLLRHSLSAPFRQAIRDKPSWRQLLPACTAILVYPLLTSLPTSCWVKIIVLTFCELLYYQVLKVFWEMGGEVTVIFSGEKYRKTIIGWSFRQFFFKLLMVSNTVFLQRSCMSRMVTALVTSYIALSWSLRTSFLFSAVCRLILLGCLVPQILLCEGLADGKTRT